LGIAAPLSFALASSLSYRPARALGVEKTLMLTVLMIILGHLLRAFSWDSTALFFGSLLSLLGMGIGNITLMVQTQGYAHVLEAQRLRLLMKRHPDWLMIISRYLWQMYQDIGRLAALSHVHDVKQRLADWLLISEQRCGEEQLIMTHAHIALMLGVRRASITLAARQMKLKGLINYSRGYIHLLDKPALQKLASS
jgi:hypothetical protein